MKNLILILILFNTTAQAQSCKEFTTTIDTTNWRISYNSCLRKYAVITGIEGQITFLGQDYTKRYGLYSEAETVKECYNCFNRGNSFFNTPCAARSFLIQYSKLKAK